MYYFFSGVYDGDEHTISGMYTIEDEDYQGLFGYAKGCQIRDLTIKDSLVTGDDYVGAFVGYVSYGDDKNKYNHFSNCVNYAIVSAQGTGSGIVGEMSSTPAVIKECVNYGNVTASNCGGILGYAGSSIGIMLSLENCINLGEIFGESRAGGIVGYLSTLEGIFNCKNEGNVSGEGVVGGICGKVYAGRVYNCSNKGNVTSIGSKVGGIVGEGLQVYYCYNNGNISGNADYIGGIVGDGEDISYCYNTGKIEGVSYVGGVAGDALVYNCYNTGVVNGENWVGGIAGAGSVYNCFNIGEVVYFEQETSGGILGGLKYDENEVKNCFWDVNLNISVAVGSSYISNNCNRCTQSEAKSINWYLSSIWDENYAWDFKHALDFKAGENQDYPILRAFYEKTMTNKYWTDYGNYAESFDGGNGSENNPFLIRTPQQLARLAYLINNPVTNEEYKSLYYKQTADINLADCIWVPIGCDMYYTYISFIGHYDGGGNSIFRMCPYENVSNKGLFGYIETEDEDVVVEISNLSMREAVLYDSDWDNADNIGTIIGYSSATIKMQNCYNYSDYISESGKAYFLTKTFGGFVGRVDSNTTSEISNCGNYGEILYRVDKIPAVYDPKFGGILGNAFNVKISNCYNTADIDVYSGATCDTIYAGGVVGYISGDNSEILNCYNTALVDSGISAGSDISYAAGIAGYASGIKSISYSYNTGRITSDSSAGGVVGSSSSTITNCYNTGSVDGDSSAGGVAGTVREDSTITNCYNTGSVDGGSSVGGVVGYANSSTITNCYNTGSVTGNDDWVGGVVGYAAGYSSSTITNCYNIGSVDGRDYVGGVVGYVYNSAAVRVTNNYYGGNCTLTSGRGTKDENLIANAKSLSWYQDGSKWNSEYPWDFDSVWAFVEGMNDGYPILQGFSVNITYNSNFGGNETVTETLPMGESVVIAGADLFEREGYTISSWNTMANGGGLSFMPGDVYQGGNGLTLYAQWEAKIIQVNLDENGGSGGTNTIYLKYDSGWYSSSSCTSSSKITALPSTPTRTGYEFKGYNTEPDGSGTLAVSETGAINVSDTFYSTDGTRTWYAVWEARNPAYYDSEGGYWYVENGKLPQSKVSESLKGTLSGQWSSLSDGSVYYMGVEELAENDLADDGGMQSRVYNGEEYVKFNGEYYLVEPIRWRLVYSSSQQEGYAVENTSILATMAEIVFLGSYSSTKIGVGAGYSAESVTMLLKNQVSTEFLVNENREVEIFDTPKDTASVSGSVFVASSEELANFKTNKNNTTGSGVKVGKVSLSDFVKDYLRATGQGNYYFTRDLGDQLNTIRCLNPVGDRSQAKAQQTLGVQFTIKVTEYACISA